MIEYEVQKKERELKPIVHRELVECQSRMMHDYPAVFNSDKRLIEYVNKVVDNYDLHNLYEMLALRRFFTFLDKYFFDVKKFKRFCKFYEALKFSGTNGRTRYKLTPIQTFQYANIYGFYDKGVRLCRQSYIVVPRKFSKTTSAAGMAVYELFFSDANAQAYCCANSYNQAKILFDEIRNILLSIDPHERHFKINREMVMWKDGSRQSFCRCLASNPKALDGLFASLCICDEYSQARNTAEKNGADLKNTITSSMGPRKEPLTVVISTCSEVLDGPFAHELEGVKSVLRGEMENDRVFASLFMPDVDDREDDPTVWQKVQPHMGVTVQPDFYAEEYKNALLSAENMMVFRTKLLNIMSRDETASWITSDFVKANSIDRELSYYVEEEGIFPDAMVGIDLSESDDLSAVTIGVYSKKTKSFFFHTHYFFPRGALEHNPNRSLYEQWAEGGYMTLLDGDVVDYSAIVDYINYANNHYVKVIHIGYDAWKSTEMINQMAVSIGANAAVVLKSVSQSYGNFNAPVESFEHGFKTNKIKINRSPINDFCFANAVIDIDYMENKKPIKRGTGRAHQNTNKNKIDGVITMLMCMRLFIDAKR